MLIWSILRSQAAGELRESLVRGSKEARDWVKMHLGVVCARAARGRQCGGRAQADKWLGPEAAVRLRGRRAENGGSFELCEAWRPRSEEERRAFKCCPLEGMFPP